VNCKCRYCRKPPALKPQKPPATKPRAKKAAAAAAVSEDEEEHAAAVGDDSEGAAAAAAGRCRQQRASAAKKRTYADVDGSDDADESSKLKQSWGHGEKYHGKAWCSFPRYSNCALLIGAAHHHVWPV
jgi:hypothetical protein